MQSVTVGKGLNSEEGYVAEASSRNLISQSHSASTDSTWFGMSAWESDRSSAHALARRESNSFWSVFPFYEFKRNFLGNSLSVIGKYEKYERPLYGPCTYNIHAAAAAGLS